MRAAFAGLALALVLVQTASGAEPDAVLVRDYLEHGSVSGAPKAVDAWQTALSAALKEDKALDRAVPILARKYGFTLDQTARFAGLWMRFAAGGEDDAKEAQRAEIDAGFIALARDTHGDPLVLAAATMASSYAGRCREGVLTALVDGAPDPVAAAWPLKTASECASWLLEFARLAPDRKAAILVSLGVASSLDRDETLALEGRLAIQPLAARMTAQDRARVRRHFAFQQMASFEVMGMTGDLLAFWNALPREDRDALLDRPMPATTVMVDGLKLPLRESGGGNATWSGGGYVQDIPSDDFVRLTLAAAYYLKGDTRMARAFLRPAMLDHAAASLDCWKRSMTVDENTPSQCAKGLGARPLEPELMLSALARPGDDAFDFVSKAAIDGQGSPFGQAILWTEALCKYLSGTSYDALCTRSRKQLGERFLENRSPGTGEKERWASRAVLALVAPGIGAETARFHAETVAADARYTALVGPAEKEGEPAGPLESHFAQAKLPDAYLGKAPEPQAWDKAFAPLPEGCELVRWERDGQRVAAISVSQNYDPTGEVSPGGYWVHLSDDGGKSWRAPLYTGLADHYPYVVPPASRLKLFDGDALDLEVAIDELDLSSITYPPVALRARRHETGIYLKIPLAELARDSDHDGLTDIAEEHLLLDPRNPDSDGDGLPDGVDPMPNVKRKAQSSDLQQLTGLLLEHIFSIKTGAIIEPVGRNGDAIESELAAAARAEPTSADRPIFVEDNGADFAGLNPGKMMLVYGEADLTRLKRMTPDFHAVSLSPIVLNRARDRGFVSWDTGWAGGTYALRREGGTWKLVSIMSWIT